MTTELSGFHRESLNSMVLCFKENRFQQHCNFKFQVSLDSRVREIINRNMIAPSQHTFDEAQLQIYTLMHRDSYPRFVNSPTYKNMLRTVGVEPPESSSSS